MVKGPPASGGDIRDVGLIPGSEDPLEDLGSWQPTPVFSPGESPGQRSLAGCSPWSHRESDTTEPLSVHACDLSWNLASV